MSKELLFRVTAADCEWIYQRGSGNGGQKKNKTNSAVRCIHRASGAAGYAEDTRSQVQNKGIAFRRMAETEQFKGWHKLESMRRLGQLFDIEEKVDREMKNIKVEGKDENGRWVDYVED
jgi:protein subunit release factor B